MSANDAVVLMSGGIDSYACAHLLQQQGLRVQGLFIEHGQAAARLELRAAQKISGRLAIELIHVAVKRGPNFATGEIIGRNGFLISTAYFISQGSAGIISIGIHAGTNYYDCSSTFLGGISQLISEQSDGKTKVVAPFLTWSKQDIVKYCRDSKLSLDDTYSCEMGKRAACNNCGSCADRRALDVS
jgi:7-cyano-7-deazaguanine synthase